MGSTVAKLECGNGSQRGTRLRSGYLRLHVMGAAIVVRSRP